MDHHNHPPPAVPVSGIYWPSGHIVRRPKEWHEGTGNDRTEKITMMMMVNIKR